MRFIVEYVKGSKPKKKTFRRLWLAEEFAKEHGPAVVIADLRDGPEYERYRPIRRYPPSARCSHDVEATEEPAPALVPAMAE